MSSGERKLFDPLDLDSAIKVELESYPQVDRITLAPIAEPLLISTQKLNWDPQATDELLFKSVYRYTQMPVIVDVFGGDHKTRRIFITSLPPELAAFYDLNALRGNHMGVIPELLRFIAEMCREPEDRQQIEQWINEYEESEGTRVERAQKLQEICTQTLNLFTVEG